MSTTYTVVLFLHICFLLIGFGTAFVMTLCAFKLRAAQTGAEAFVWGPLMGKAARGFPLAIAGLFLTGAYMAQDVGWDWGSGWIVSGIAGLVFLGAEGGLIGARHGKELEAALKENGPGPLGARVQELASARLPWVVTFGAPGLVLAIVWNMLHKPDLAEALVGMVVGYAIGAALGLWVASQKPRGAAVTRD
jgi:uncharacterized membrane protein